jgi:hypothetical protein
MESAQYVTKNLQIKVAVVIYVLNAVILRQRESNRMEQVVDHVHTMDTAKAK